MPKECKMLINGKWLSGKETIDVTNPYNQQVLGTIPKATNEDVNTAIESAQQAFEIIANLPAYQRSKILERTSDLIQKHQKEIAKIIASESGKAWKYAIEEMTNIRMACFNL